MRGWLTTLVAWGIAAPAAAADPVAVVNLTGPSATATTRALRAHLVERGLGLRLPVTLGTLVEGAELPPPYAPDLQAARAAYAAFEYGKAQQLLAQQTEQAAEQAAGGALLQAMREIFVWRAVVAVAQQDREGAVQWFRAVRRLDPGFVLDPTRFNPRVQQAFRQARRPPARDSIGTLVVEGMPAEARLSIDGQPDTTADRNELPDGPHLVVIRRPGDGRQAAVVAIAPGQTTRLVAQLRPETPRDRAERALAAARGAADPEQRGTALAALGRSLGTTRLLLVEGDEARLYHLERRRASAAIDLSAPDHLQRVERLAAAAKEPVAAPAPAATALRPEPEPEPGPAADSASTPFYRRWWFWTAVGVVAAGAGVVTYVAVTRDGDPTLVCCQ